MRFLLILTGLIVFATCIEAQYDDYDIIRLIGNGASAKVFRVQNKLNGQYYAMKAIRKTYVSRNSFYSQMQAERDILASNRSPFTLRLFEAFSDDTFLYLITPLCNGGDLMSLILREDTFSEDVARFYVAEILLGLEALHLKSITLRDLKFENILISDSGHLKLADFGLATLFVEDRYDSKDFIEVMKLDKLKNQRRLSGTITRSTSRAQRPALGSHKRSQTSVPRLENRVDPDSKAGRIREGAQRTHRRKFHSILGTIDYTAVELWGDEGYTSACDLWSLGVIFFEMLMGYPTFISDTPAETVRKIRQFDKHLLFLDTDPRVGLSPEAISLIKGLICKEQQRLTIPQIKNHPFFLRVDWDELKKSASGHKEGKYYRPPFVPRVNEFNEAYFPMEELAELMIEDKKLGDEVDMETLWKQRKGTMMVDTEEVFSQFKYIGF